MKAPLTASLALAVSVLLAACGGGGGGGSSVTPTSAPITPTGPTTPASQPAFGTANVNGASAQVLQSSSNQHTLYTFGADTANTSNCSSTSTPACTATWPPYTAPAGTSASSLGTGFGLITRSDGSLQYTYQTFPLYMYAADGASGTANGQGITSFGGTWDAAQPAGAAAGPTAPPSRCVGYYC